MKELDEKIKDFRDLMMDKLSFICFKGKDENGFGWATIGLRDIDQRYIDLITAITNLFVDMTKEEDPMNEFIELFEMTFSDFINYIADGYDLDQELWPELWGDEGNGVI